MDENLTRKYTSGCNGGSGGRGEVIEQITIDVTPLTTLAITVGSGGEGGKPLLSLQLVGFTPEYYRESAGNGNDGCESSVSIAGTTLVSARGGGGGGGAYALGKKQVQKVAQWGFATEPGVDGISYSEQYGDYIAGAGGAGGEPPKQRDRVPGSIPERNPDTGVVYPIPNTAPPGGTGECGLAILEYGGDI